MPRRAGDQRISMVPDVAEQLIKDGYGAGVSETVDPFKGAQSREWDFMEISWVFP